MASTWKKTAGWLGTAALVLTLVGCGGAAPEPEPQPEPEPEVEAEIDEAAERAAREAAERERMEEEARRLEAERQRVMGILDERVHFEFDKSDLDSEAEAILQRKVTVLREYPGMTLRIEGHCDERGSIEYNLALGQRRAESVRRFLTSYGLEEGRFETISFGEERPAAMGHDEDSWAQNRRDDFGVTNQGQLGSR